MPHIAEEYAQRDPTGLAQAFIDQVPYCRQPWGARIPKFPTAEDIIQEIFDRILLNGEPVKKAAHAVALRLETVLPDGS